MNTAEYIVKKLEELGISDFFGLPGDYNFNILTAIENNKNIKWIGCTNELNAGYAADGYARLRGYGALVTTYGVGELSAINAIAGSYAENIPVCHIVGIPSSQNIESKKMLHHNFQEVNYHTFCQLYKEVTAATAFLTRDNAKIEIDRVLKIMVKEKKPVYIAIPSDIAQMEISDRYTSLDWESDKDTLNEVSKLIADKINQSQMPIIVGDSLVKRFDAKIYFNEFVSKSNIPVTNFLMGTDIVDANYENYLGTYFGRYANPAAQEYMNNTDCLIAVGTIYSDINSFGCELPYKINDHIAIYGTYTCVNGKRYDSIKMSDVLETITNYVEQKNTTINNTDLGYDISKVENVPITSSYIYPRLQEFFKENDIIFAETGTVPSSVGLIKFPNNVNTEYQILWGSIGWATPAAMGASIAKVNSRVILITGDGAHQLTAMEVGNMIRQGSKPVIIVINNNGYTTERYLCGNQEAPYNDIINMNYTKFARAFDGDIWATKVSTDDDFDKALKVTQIMNKLCYIEVCSEKSDVIEHTKTMLETIEKAALKKTAPKTIHSEKEQKNDDLTISSPASFNYETTVHKKFEEKLK